MLDVNGDGLTDQFDYSTAATQKRKFPTLRMDYNLTSSHRLSFVGRYNDFNSTPDLLNSADPTFPGFPNYGSQVSGRIAKLYVDFNSVVRKGQVLAQLDPTFLQAALDQAFGEVVGEISGRGEIDRFIIGVKTVVEELERALIMRASYATKWNQSRTAELLNLKRDKLRYRMKLYALQSEDGASTPQE